MRDGVLGRAKGQLVDFSGDRVCYRILGEVEAVIGERTVAIRSVRKRLILALLLRSAGRVVSSARLIDALWEGGTPESAAENLRVYVYKLRKDIGDGHGIESRAGGYLLRVPPDRLDSHRFEALAAHGDEASETDPAAAIMHYRDALALWRGPVFGSLAEHPQLRDFAHHLGERRMAVLEESIQAELDHGSAGQLVPELFRLVAEQPLREELRALLMLALHSCGRQAEALEVYRETHRVLAEELGLNEPGQRLRDLHQAILAGLPLTDPSRSRPQNGLVPAELPADIRDFTGRSAEMVRLRARLDREHGPMVISAITGIGGIGKSTLAVHLGNQVANNYADGQLYINLRGSTPGADPVEPHDALARLLRSLGTDDASIPADTDEAAARFRSLTAERRILLLLDNARDAAQVRPLLPGGSSCAVLITSRRPLTALCGAYHYELDALSEAEAIELLDRLIAGERVASDPVGTAAIARLCGRLPLALSIAAARLSARTNRSPSWLADRLAVVDRRLSELERGDRAIRASIAVSYDDLDHLSAHMFRVAALLDGADIAGPTAAAAADCTEDEAELLLERLVDAQLVASPVRGRYRYNDLLRLFARERALEEDGPEERRQAVRRAAHHYLATARTATRLLHPKPNSLRMTLHIERPIRPGLPMISREDAYSWIDAEALNTVSLFRQLEKPPPGNDDLIVALMAAIAIPLAYRGKWRDEFELARISIRSAECLEDLTSQAIINGDLGDAEIRLGRFDNAASHVKKSLDAYGLMGDRPNQAYQLTNLASVYRHFGDYQRSVETSLQAIKIHHDVGQGAGEYISWLRIGLVYQTLSEFDKAIHAHTQAYRVAQGMEERRDMAMALGNIAQVDRLAGCPATAVSKFREALDLVNQDGSHGSYEEAELLWGLGCAQRDLSEQAQARESWGRSAAILCDLELIAEEELRAIEATPTPETPRIIADQL